MERQSAAKPEDQAEETTSASQDALTAITAERDQLAAEKADMQDRVLRTQAEFQNLRRRVEKEKSELLEYASMEAVRTLLPILDDFDRAVEVETADETYAKGVELIHQRLIEALKKLGLEPIPAEGQPFDPNIHHAVEMVETADQPDHTVLAEYRRGYNFKNRLLRPSMVKVAVEPKQS